MPERWNSLRHPLFLRFWRPGVLAEELVDRCRTMRGAMFVVCALAGFLSKFLEKVPVVLLVSPVVLSLSEKLRVSPVQLITGVAVCSNLWGAAALIGDLPRMIMAGYMKMSFNVSFMLAMMPIAQRQAD